MDYHVAICKITRERKESRRSEESHVDTIVALQWRGDYVTRSSAVDTSIIRRVIAPDDEAADSSWPICFALKIVQKKANSIDRLIRPEQKNVAGKAGHMCKKLVSCCCLDWSWLHSAARMSCVIGHGCKTAFVRESLSEEGRPAILAAAPLPGEFRISHSNVTVCTPLPMTSAPRARLRLPLYLRINAAPLRASRRNAAVG